MKKFDYYAAHDPWKMPKWIGATLGGVFSVLAVGATVLILQLTRPAHASAPAPVVAAAVAPAPAKVETPPPPATTAPAPKVAVAAVAAVPHAKSASSHKGKHDSKHAKVASRAMSPDRSSSILAKHDSREKRKAKDDLDRMLGL